ncbi:MAG TPA: hypothetical protein VFB16_09615 [Bauldia sp.]|nr:hypothetical protein [Bauldia sp.]
MAATVKIPPSPDYDAELKSGDMVVEPTPNARAGVSDHNVRYVLAYGIIGVIVAFVAIYLFFFA